MTQEHGRVEPVSGLLDYDKYPLGSLLTLIPYHVSTIHCGWSLTVCQFYHVIPLLSDPFSLYFHSRVQLQ